MATITSVLSLQDRMTPTLSKSQRQALQNINTYNQMAQSVDSVRKSLEAAEKANPKIVESAMYSSAAEALEKMEGNLWDVANSEKKLKNATQETTNTIETQIMKLASLAAVAKGINSLMDMSDTYSQNTARLNLMNDGLQTTAQLQNQIYAASQRSRTSYDGFTKTVANLGMQAGKTFSNNNMQVVAFTELLDKMFTTAGMDSTAIQSTMYNLTQSLSTGQLLGQDFRIISQNAPQMIQYLQDYYKVSRSELKKMVSDGKVSAMDLKKAIFKNADDINKKFKAMPMTFAQAGQQFKDSFTKSMEPLLNVFSKILQQLSAVFDFVGSHQEIIYGLIAGIGILVTTLLTYNAVTFISSTITKILSGSFGGVATKAAIVSAIIGVLVGVLLYLWNTNDTVAYGMLYAWDALQLGVEAFKLGATTAFYSVIIAALYMYQGILGTWLALQTTFYAMQVGVLTLGLAFETVLQGIVNAFIWMYNKVTSILNKLGAHFEQADYADFTSNTMDTLSKTMEKYSKSAAKTQEQMASVNAEIDKYKQKLTSNASSSATNIQNMAQNFNSSREDRVKNRKKLGSGLGDMNDTSSISKAIEAGMNDVSTNDGTGKAIKTKSTNKLLDDDDIQLLLDVATRDYKLNYQQVTPNITLTFGDVRETVDVDNMLDEVADKLQEIYDGNLEVATT